MNGNDGGKVIAFINMKGGVGKTTLCKEIAYYLGREMKRKILLIDVDPQCNLTQAFLQKFGKIQDKPLMEKPTEKTLDNILTTSRIIEGENKDCILNLTENIDIIPGDMQVTFLNRVGLSSQDEAKIFNYIEKNKLKLSYDYIFIDCPPTYSFHTTIALNASDFYFVPVKPDVYSILGLDLLLQVIDNIICDNPIFNNRDLKCLGVIYTLYKPRGMKSKRYAIDKFLQSKNIRILNTQFRNYDRMGSGKIRTFIMDRSYEPIKKELAMICEEFERGIADELKKTDEQTESVQES